MFRPAGFSDSDEDSDYGYDFCYGNSENKKESTRWNESPPVMVENNDDLLYKAVNEGNLEEIKRVLDIDPYLLTSCLRQGWPLLLLACNEAQHDVVKYLLEVRRLDVNQANGLSTPLMAVCSSNSNSDAVLRVAELLLEFGAVINCKDAYGMTPLMFAIINDHTEVVRLILDQTSLEATDNEGLTALFHAVNNKRKEIVEMLLKAGALVDIVNRRGFTPKQEAEFRGYNEIADLFPSDQDYFEIPNKYLGYAHYRDVTQGETESVLPGYQQEIGLLLYGMYSEQHLTTFAKENFDLLRFLTLTDDELKELEFKLPFERKKILFGLMKFHRQAWSKKSMKKFPLSHRFDSYDVLEMLANHLKQLTVLQASLIHVAQMIPAKEMKNKFASELDDCLRKANQLRQTVATFSEEVERINSLTASKPVLYVDKNSCQTERVCWFARALKITLLSAVVSLVVYRKLKA
ncbi:ankyrin repeat, SAM and basic leucine zipper domain-containing protein 1 [Armigeres subalbatus]|uniref:ankyrin repeat, SAM and basic leucine zipper domain-containing protein 1 n=1 Tax=Armigeres subalbatus TaxID=124917 RepID=UPI002ED3385F